MSNKLHHLEPLLLLAFEPNDVVSKLGGICLKPDGNKLWNTDTLDREGRVKLFIKILHEKGETDGNIYQEFLDVLRTIGQYRWLLPLLTDDTPCNNLLCALEYVEKIPVVVEMFSVIYPAFEGIDTRDLLRDLSSHLSVKDKEEIEASTDRCGNTHGFYILINKLLIKEPSWIQDLISSIEKSNYNATCEMFDDSQYPSLAEALRTFFDYLPKHDDLSEKKSTATSHMHYQENSEQPNEKPALPFDQNDQNVDKLGEPIIPIDQEDNVENTAFKLYGYQEELCEKALSGKSVIICAPTGCGKTLVAAKIIEDHLRKNESAKVLFFTPTGGLANQQYEKLKGYLPETASKIEKLIGGNSGNDFDLDLRAKIYSNTIIVMTPQLLINALKPKESDIDRSPTVESIFDFSLMIFDECHHAYKSDPYNQVLVKYLQAKKEQKKSIQIIGLSATLGIREAKCQESAVQHMISLCGSLDATGGVVLVRKPENVDELEEKCPGNREEMLPVSKDNDNVLKNEIRETIYKVIRMLDNFGVFSNDRIHRPDENTIRNIDLFRQWCVQVQIASCQYDDKLNRNSLGRDTASCVETLRILNDAIEIYNYCRPGDAVALLQNFVDEKFEQSEEKNTKNEMRFHSIMKEMLSKLEAYSVLPECQNENLNTIEREIRNKVGQDPDSRVILMVPKKVYTRYLKDWMNDTPSLEYLKAEIFTGVSPGSNNIPGITHNQQIATLKMFNEGEIKAIIATPDAAGEGLDVDGCNLVINYNYMRNEISKLQTIGRARKKDSRVVHLSSERAQSHDRLTLIKIHLMKRATAYVEKLQRKKPQKFQELLEASQKITINVEILAEKKRSAQPEKDAHNIYSVLCRKCSEFICESRDIIRLEKTHHSVHSEDFKNKYEVEDHPRKGSACGGTDMRKMGKLHCLECKCDWGVVVSWRSHLVPLLAITGVKFKVARGEHPMVVVSKWKNAPFEPRDCDPDNDVSLMYFDLDTECLT